MILGMHDIPMRMRTTLILNPTFDLFCPSHLFDGECFQVVWSECEERDLLTRLLLHHLVGHSVLN